MNKAFKFAVMLFVLFTTTAAVSLATSNTSYAADTTVGEPAAAQRAAVKPGKVLSIVPICSDVATATSVWEVTNENNEVATFTWNNVENNATGSVDAPKGTTKFTTYYNVADPNNRTEFNDPYHDVPASRNAQVSPCAPVTPPAPTCIDGRVYGNIEFSKITNYSYSVKAKGGKLLCNDVTIYLSSYLLPETYTGNGEFDETATPQTKFDSDLAVLKAGTNGVDVLVVGLPDSCMSHQVDLYYGPEIETVGPNGHDGQNLDGKIYPGYGECYGNGGVTPPVEPPVVTPPVVTPPVVTPPVTPVTPPAPVTPVTETEELGMGAVTELPETGGISSVSSALSALLLGMITYVSMYFITNRKHI
jgi:hypothetical protein